MMLTLDVLFLPRFPLQRNRRRSPVLHLRGWPRASPAGRRVSSPPAASSAATTPAPRGATRRPFGASQSHRPAGAPPPPPPVTRREPRGARCHRPAPKPAAAAEYSTSSGPWRASRGRAWRGTLLVHAFARGVAFIQDERLECWLRQLNWSMVMPGSFSPTPGDLFCR